MGYAPSAVKKAFRDYRQELIQIQKQQVKDLTKITKSELKILDNAAK